MEDFDLDLAMSARAGNPDAFGELVIRHQNMLAAMLHRFASSTPDLEDMVQDSFVKAWTALPNWEPRQPFVHWLRRIAVRTAFEYCRKRKRSPILSMPVLPEAATNESEMPGKPLEEARALLSHLSPEDQILLTMVHLQGMSMEEVADSFGWSRSNAKIKAFRARHSLRKILNRYGYTFE